MGLQGKHFKDPHPSDCGMVAWFICDSCPYPWVSNVPSPSMYTMSSTRLRQRPVPRVSASYSFRVPSIYCGTYVTTRPTWLHALDRREDNEQGKGRSPVKECENALLPLLGF